MEMQALMMEACKEGELKSFYANQVQRPIKDARFDARLI